MGGKRKRERKYIVILIKSALERSRGLSRCTLSHESSHDNDTKCRPRDLGPPRDGGALITILRARRATSARCYTSRCPRPAPSGSLLPRALSLPVRATVSLPRSHPLAPRAASISIDTRSMLHFAPDRGDSRQAALLDRLRFCAARPCARAERLLMSRDSSAEMMTGDRARE